MEKWKSKASCASIGEIFIDEEFAEENRELVNKVCERCPVKQECLEYAIDNRFIFDSIIWAGTTGRERYKMVYNKENNDERNL